MFSSSTNYSKLKTNLRLAINRLKLLEKKKTELAQKGRKDIADYIVSGKDDRARIRVEHIIREDYLVEAMELLEMYCDLLLARFGLIQTQKELDPGLEEAIATLIWSAPRLQTDVQELKAISDQFIAKYGKEFGQACRTNALNNVSEKVMHKLGVQAPPKILVERYMVEIAKTYNVPFEPDQSVMVQDEIYAAENMLIDLVGDDKKKGGGGGPSGGMGVLQPQSMNHQLPYPPPPAKYSPPYPTAEKSFPGMKSGPPPLPQTYPAGPRGASPGPYLPGPLDQPPSYRSASSGYPMGPPPPGKGNMDDTFPELPAVPNNTLPDHSVGGSSAGGDDVDFDDLAKRFEDLKRRK